MTCLEVKHSKQIKQKYIKTKISAIMKYFRKFYFSFTNFLPKGEFLFKGRGISIKNGKK